MADSHVQGTSIHVKRNSKCMLEKLWPECVHDNKGFSPDEIHHDAVDKSVTLTQLIGGDGFDDVAHEEFNELIDTHSQALTDED